MRHGRKFEHLGVTSSHGAAMLRSLVSSLLHHEAIRTTLPKAKATARMAEKVITWGKKDTVQTRRRAEGFLRSAPIQTLASFNQSPTKPPLKPPGYPNIEVNEDEQFEPPKSLMPKLFLSLKERYATRPGGYTRIHKFGRRHGDNAPIAIVELVDGPKDAKYEMVARTVGREAAVKQGLGEGEVLDGDVESWRTRIHRTTRAQMDKALKFRSDKDKQIFERRAKDFADVLAVEGKVTPHQTPSPQTDELDYSESRRMSQPFVGRKPKAGERYAGMDVGLSGLKIARGALGKQYWNKPVYDKTPRFLTESPRANTSAVSHAVPASAKGL